MSAMLDNYSYATAKTFQWGLPSDVPLVSDLTGTVGRIWPSFGRRGAVGTSAIRQATTAMRRHVVPVGTAERHSARQRF